MKNVFTKNKEKLLINFNYHLQLIFEYNIINLAGQNAQQDLIYRTPSHRATAQITSIIPPIGIMHPTGSTISLFTLIIPIYISSYGSILFGPLNINIVSFNAPVSNKSIVNLSIPSANPPCGGHPYLKNSK